MTKGDIDLLFAYDRWANQRIFEAASTLTPEQFIRDLGFCSIRDTLLHIVSGEWIWLNYWRATSHDSAFLSHLKTRRESLFNPARYPDAASVQARWLEVEKDQIEFVNTLTEATLDRLVPAQETQISVRQLLQHVANHSTYHRGQVALMLRQLGAKPLATDFHVFIGEMRRNTEDQK